MVGNRARHDRALRPCDWNDEVATLVEERAAVLAAPGRPLVTIDFKSMIQIRPITPIVSSSANIDAESALTARTADGPSRPFFSSMHCNGYLRVHT